MVIEEINPDEWYYLVRIGTNECFINKSNFINVCTREQAERILPGLNFYVENWEMMTISDYNTKFRMVGI